MINKEFLDELRALHAADPEKGHYVSSRLVMLKANGDPNADPKILAMRRERFYLCQFEIGDDTFEIYLKNFGLE